VAFGGCTGGAASVLEAAVAPSAPAFGVAGPSGNEIVSAGREGKATGGGSGMAGAGGSATTSGAGAAHPTNVHATVAPSSASRFEVFRIMASTPVS